MKIKTRTYSLNIARHPEGYLAVFPALPGCNTWGRTFEQAIKNAEEALALYLETLDELRRPAPIEHQSSVPISLGITVRTPIIA